MTLTRTLLTLSLCALGFSTGVLAAEPAAPGKDKAANFQEHKSTFISHLQEREGQLQKLIACAKAANDQDAMRKCREQHKQALEAMHDKHKADRQSRRDERRAARQGMSGMGMGPGMR